jgi:hypothetical protein
MAILADPKEKHALVEIAAYNNFVILSTLVRKKNMSRLYILCFERSS